MFADLPECLQEKVLEHLQENNFPAAKALYDDYHQQQRQQTCPAIVKPTKKRPEHAHSHSNNDSFINWEG
jgi:hypothetical protein